MHEYGLARERRYGLANRQSPRRLGLVQLAQAAQAEDDPTKPKSMFDAVSQSLAYGSRNPATAPFDIDPAGLLSGMGRAPGIRAYHGSPHDFDRFDTSRIGTGEGAQTYGRGLYFAESPEVAAFYKEEIPFYAEGHIKPAPRSSLAHRAVEDRASFEELIDAGGAEFQKNQVYYVRMPDESVVEIGPGGAERALIIPPGRMYEVEIAARPEEFLDWDTGLPRQSQLVKDAAEALGIRARMPNASGRAIYQQLADEIGHERATAAMREAGIPGIKYLDQGSRQAGEGSRNYVVFDDKLVRILRKFGLPLTAAGASIAAEMGLLDDGGTAEASAPRYHTGQTF